MMHVGTLARLVSIALPFFLVDGDRTARAQSATRPSARFDWFSYDGHDSVFDKEQSRCRTSIAIRFSPASIRIRASCGGATTTTSSRRASRISRAFRSSTARISSTGRRSAMCSIGRRSSTLDSAGISRGIFAPVDSLSRRHVLHDHDARRSRRELHRHGDESGRPVVRSDVAADVDGHRSVALLRRRRPSVRRQQRPARRDAAVRRPSRDLDPGVRRRARRRSSVRAR